MASKLTVENFKKAHSYLMDSGRELERELFQFHFENGDPNDVISLLSQYQGENGGFKNMGEGHSVIPNAMDTCLAFQYLSEVGAPSNDEVVQKGIQYIIDSYDSEFTCWQARPNERANGWSDNPCAELVGYLYEYRDLVPGDFLRTVTEKAIASMSSIHTSVEPRQFYFLTALCLLRLAVRIDEPYKSYILDQLTTEITEIIETDSGKWSNTYCAKPFFFAPSPNSPLFLPIKEYVVQSLENEIKTQSEDGHFILNWKCDEDGAVVWKSIWTMDVLKALHQHDMIEQEMKEES